MDPELARYLNRNYWQSRSDEMVGTSLPSAPSGAPNSQSAKERTVEVRLFFVCLFGWGFFVSFCYFGSGSNKIDCLIYFYIIFWGGFLFLAREVKEVLTLFFQEKL